MKLPSILLHAFNSDSKTVSYGWALSMTSTALYLLVPTFSAERWERMILIASILVGGKMAKELVLDHAEIKATSKETNAPANPPAAA